MFANFPFCGMQLQHLLLVLCTCSAGGLLHFGVTIDTKLRAWIGNHWLFLELSVFANFPFCGMQLQHLLLVLCTCSAGGLLHFGVTIDTKLRAWIGNHAQKIGLPAFRFWDEML